MIVAMAMMSAQNNRFVARLQRLLHAAPGGMHTAAAASQRRRSHAPVHRSCVIKKAQQVLQAIALRLHIQTRKRWPGFRADGHVRGETALRICD